MPKVSVILSSYNHEKYIAESINSVLNQTYGDFELLIYDDGSTDNSQEIIRSFKDARIKLFLYEKNRGAFRATQEALHAAQGKYIAIHHSDDVWEPTKLEKQVNFMDTHLEYAACFTQVKFIDETSEIYNLADNHHYKNVFKQKNRPREEWLNYFFWNMNCLCNPSALARNDLSIIVQNPCLYQLPDYFMWLNVLLKKNIYVLEEELTRFRLRRYESNSMSSWSAKTVIRTNNENSFVVKAFLPLLNSEETFLKVFPEAEEFRVNGELVKEFAFAQLCLRHSSPAHIQFGIELLYQILQDTNQAAKVKELYDYDDRNFVEVTGICDIYGINSQLKKLHACLYIDCGNGFNEQDIQRREVLLRANGEFFAQFNYSPKSPAKQLRFDPDESGMMAMKLTRILINGETVTNFNSNALEVVDGYHEFLGVDPQFFINHAVDAANLNVQISGVLSAEYLSKFEISLTDKVNLNTWNWIKRLVNSDDWELIKRLVNSNDLELIKRLENSNDLELVKRLIISNDWELIKRLVNSNDLELIKRVITSNDWDLLKRLAVSKKWKWIKRLVNLWDRIKNIMR